MHYLLFATNKIKQVLKFLNSKTQYSSIITAYKKINKKFCNNLSYIRRFLLTNILFTQLQYNK